MGQMCCTKYGEDSQNAIRNSKQKKPEKGIVNQTGDGSDIGEADLSNLNKLGGEMQSRNHKGIADNSDARSMNSFQNNPNAPQNTVMNDNMSDYMAFSSRSAQTHGRQSDNMS